jgi:uncharacterized protein YuzE
MARRVKVWYDAEGDFMEVAFSDEAGSMRETDNEAVMERINKDGQVIGFSILGVGQLSKEKPPEAELVDA